MKAYLLASLICCVGWMKGDSIQKIGKVAPEGFVIHQLNLQPNEPFAIAVDFEDKEHIVCSLTDSNFKMIVKDSSTKSGLCQFMGDKLQKDASVILRIFNTETHEVGYSVVAK